MDAVFAHLSGACTARIQWQQRMMAYAPSKKLATPALAVSMPKQKIRMQTKQQHQASFSIDYQPSSTSAVPGNPFPAPAFQPEGQTQTISGIRAAFARLPQLLRGPVPLNAHATGPNNPRQPPPAPANPC